MYPRSRYLLIPVLRNDEVAQYLTTLKTYEHKSDDSLKEKVHQEYHDQLQHVLTSGKKVNKTDADNLASQFGVSRPKSSSNPLRAPLHIFMLSSIPELTVSHLSKNQS